MGRRAVNELGGNYYMTELSELEEVDWAER